MQLVANQLKTLALGVTLSASAFSGAWAQDADAALERFRALMSEQGIEMAWANADISGDDATITGVTVNAEGGPQPIGDITFTDISQVDDGYRVERISMPSYEATESGGTVTLTDVVMDAVFLPDEGVEVAGAEVFFYEYASLGAARFEMEGREVFSLTNLNARITPPEGDGELAFTGGAERFTADLTAADNPEQQAVIERLGYEQISGQMDFAGSWAAGDGRLKLSQYDFIIEDAGTLGITVDISGYTPAFIKALRETTERMAANPEGDQSAQGLALLGLMQQINIHGMEIRFDDASLTNRVIDYAAEDQGATRADVVNQTKAVFPLILAQLNAPQLMQMATGAVSAFLDDPQSLTIRAAPATPVPFAMVLAAGAASPDLLVQQLGLTVTAND
ncbi:hypothetical protein GTW25_16955 [Aliihoeflea aestuarii]|uniref:hypothetical protein n=1 Tax=Aliihoeflea aestuarii TaxID=453840 RepID=UPI0020965875|nr:hypothetical protein [Aliihoeflea aestuarii]MCO6392717.1 hypothetical protein [Aliihoeflea aestuarii]